MCCKLNYFCVAGWEEEWIEAAHKIVREEFDRVYAGICLESEEEELLPTFFTTCFHAQALPLPTRNCILNSHNTLALDLNTSKTCFFVGSKCRQFICACHVWHAIISVFLICFLSSHRQSKLTFPF